MPECNISKLTHLETCCTTLAGSESSVARVARGIRTNGAVNCDDGITQRNEVYSLEKNLHLLSMEMIICRSNNSTNCEFPLQIPLGSKKGSSAIVIVNRCIDASIGPQAPRAPARIHEHTLSRSIFISNLYLSSESFVLTKDILQSRSRLWLAILSIFMYLPGYRKYNLREVLQWLKWVNSTITLPA